MALIQPMQASHWKTFELMQAGDLRVHFSQWGEDAVLWHFFHDFRDGFYVDVGAHHPHALSNTALLHHYNGWSGINVEPDKRLFDLFLQLRPNDINLCCGVGLESGTKKMGIFKEGAINSFDERMVQDQIVHGGHSFEEWRDIPIKTLRSILEEYVPPGRQIDVLNVDVEGWDLAVLRSNDWQKYQPGIILVEDHEIRLSKAGENEIFQFLNEQGYDLISQTLATSIYKSRHYSR